MDAGTLAQYEARAQVIKALAHPARLRMIDELRSGERCVCELTGIVGSDMSTVSRHLALLKNAGLILSEKRGNQVYYKLVCPCIAQFFQCVETVLEENRERRLGAA